MVGFTIAPGTAARHARVRSPRSRLERQQKRLALALLVAAGEGLLVTLLGTPAAAIVVAAAIPPLEFHLLRRYALRRRADRNLSRVAATAQTLAAAIALAAAAGPAEGRVVVGLFAAGAVALLLAWERRPNDAQV